MPIYEYGCKCGNRLEVIQAIGNVSPVCSACGEGMVKMPTFPAMVKMAGIYSTPAERRFYEGTAPFTERGAHVWQEGDPREPVKEKEGRKWLAHGVFEGVHRDPEATYGRSRKNIVRDNPPPSAGIKSIK